MSDCNPFRPDRDAPTSSRSRRISATSPSSPLDSVEGSQKPHAHSLTCATSVHAIALGPTNAPFVWSETRQELCESLPYYRAYQQGSYVKGGSANLTSRAISRETLIVRDSYVNGYLLGGFPSRRDVWSHNGRVIISHGGGKSAVGGSGVEIPGDGLSPKSSPSKIQLKADQEESNNVIAALIQTMKMKLPLVLIAAENYALLPMKLNCAFAILGWYIITDAWAEKEQDDPLCSSESFVRWKFRFEWIEAQGDPWWCLDKSMHRPEPWDPRTRMERFTKEERSLTFLKSHCKKASKERADLKDEGTAARHSEEAKMVAEPPRKRLKRGPMNPSVPVNSSVRTDEPFNAKDPICVWCRRPSPIVFDTGWRCLAPKCPRFFAIGPSDSLRFSENFLAPRGDKVHGGFPGGHEPWFLIPTTQLDTSLDQSRGLWCSKCGRLSCRAVINRPRCPHCNYRVGPRQGLPLVPPPQIQSRLIDGGNDVAIVSPASNIVTRIKRENGLVAYSFQFPERFGGCAVHLVQADVGRGEQETKADGIFTGFQEGCWPRKDKSAKYQEKAAKAVINRMDLGFVTSQPEDEVRRSTLVPFRRHPLRCSTIKGMMLTQQFTVNYGMAYKHVVAMGTNPIDGTTPKCISGSMSLIETRTATVCPVRFNDESGSRMFHCSSTNEPLQRGFNEAYGCLYLPFQSMSFHDDGEPGLGPIVSSLSLGAEATMKFRVKAKYLVDATRTFRDDGVQATRKQMQVFNKDRTVLTIKLRHGSVCVQEGAELQKRFEHAVEPSGFRMACTTRFIDPDVNGR